MQFDFVSSFRSAEEEQATPEDCSTVPNENAVLPWKLANYDYAPDRVSIQLQREKKKGLYVGILLTKQLIFGLTPNTYNSIEHTGPALLKPFFFNILSSI